MKTSSVGLGYVGRSSAAPLAARYREVRLDVDFGRINSVYSRYCVIDERNLAR